MTTSDSSFLHVSLNQAKNGGGGNRTRVRSQHEWLNGAENYVYFVQSGAVGPIKIGVAKRPLERLRTLQTSNPEELRLLGVCPNESGKLEEHLHTTLFRSLRRGEWFNPTSEVLAAVKEHARPFPPKRDPIQLPLDEEERDRAIADAAIIETYGSRERYEQVAANMRALSWASQDAAA